MAGQLKVTYDDGAVYDGQWSEDGKRNGIGKLIFDNKTTYAGQFKDGFFEGSGILTQTDGAKYEGDFQVGKYHGYGIYSAPNGMKYEGQFQDGRYCGVWRSCNYLCVPNRVRGYGLVTFSDGTHGRPRNEGRFEDNKCIERCKATDALHKCKQSATKARTVVQQLT